MVDVSKQVVDWLIFPFQLLVGKHFLKQAWARDDGGELSKQAVDWLIKSSRQGNEEATELLQKCLETNSGK